MAYYSKQDIINYVSDSIKLLQSKNLKPINPEAEVLKKLNDEEDLVVFFWLDIAVSTLKLEGNSWYRIDHNLYTDDRFAIDSYHAMKSSITVSELILNRQMEQEIARKSIVDISPVENRIKERVLGKIEEDGAE